MLLTIIWSALLLPTVVLAQGPSACISACPLPPDTGCTAGSADLFACLCDEPASVAAIRTCINSTCPTELSSFESSVAAACPSGVPSLSSVTVSRTGSATGSATGSVTGTSRPSTSTAPTSTTRRSSTTTSTSRTSSGSAASSARPSASAAASASPSPSSGALLMNANPAVLGLLGALVGAALL